LIITISHHRHFSSTRDPTSHPANMFTENSLLTDAKDFLNGKNLYNGNLLENKDFAYYSIADRTNNQVSQEHIAMNVDMDDDL
jgi:hypothetical protein